MRKLLYKLPIRERCNVLHKLPFLKLAKYFTVDGISYFSICVIEKKEFFPLPVLEVATYSIPCEKQCSLASTPTHKNVCPCDLSTVIAIQSFIGNCNRLNSNGNSVDDGIRGILGINRRPPLV